MWIWIPAALLALLVLGFILLCRYIGGKFLRNLHRLEPGEPFKADIDVSFYQNSPHKAAAEKGLALMETLPHERVTLQSRDGLTLSADYFPAPEDTGRVVLGIHGFQSKAWHEYAPFIAFYHSLGFSMLLPDDRAHGHSQGRYITMGVKDRLDCVDWAKYLVGRFGPRVRILLHGVSMGGAAVLAASAEEDLPAQVFGIVSDCGYTSVEDQLRFQFKTVFNLPASDFPIRICRWFAVHKAGFDFCTATPLQQVKKARVPILFVQGGKDFLVPEEMAHRLYEACPGPKRLLVVPEASHAESIAVAPEQYHQAVREFFQI